MSENQVTIPEGKGLHADIPATTYHAWDACSQSRLNVLRTKTPAHLREAIDNPGPWTDALRFGSALHMAVLQPELFQKRWAVKYPRAEGYMAKNKALTESGFDLLSAAEWTACERMRDAVRNHPTAARVLGGEAERSAVWTDPETGLLCKARFDDIRRTACVVDLKTTTDASPEAFSRSVWNYGYHLQAAHYLAGAEALGIDATHFVIIAIEKDPPYALKVYRIQDDALWAGQEQRKRLMAQYAKCIDSNGWPGYPVEPEDITLPTWAWDKVEGT